MRFLFLFFCVAFNWFNKVSGVFYRFFGSKWVENDFLSKKKRLCFSGHYSGRILRMNKRVIC